MKLLMQKIVAGVFALVTAGSLLYSASIMSSDQAVSLNTIKVLNTQVLSMFHEIAVRDKEISDLKDDLLDALRRLERKEKEVK